MRILVLGAAGFIGTNLLLSLSGNESNRITAVDQKQEYFQHLSGIHLGNTEIMVRQMDEKTDFCPIVAGHDVVYHLLSTTVPTTSNLHISEELSANVNLSANLLEACVKEHVNKVVFLSSGGTVYGKEDQCPLNEKTPTNPITSYGIQKITIEKLLYLYHYLHGLDYRIIRLSNPYGPYQRPNGVLGAVSTFTYKALKGENITVYGDGSVVRDFIYIDDAIRGIQKIVEGTNRHHTFNLGSGYGTSIRQVLDTIEKVLGVPLNIQYTESRKVDVPVNFLDITRYETAYGSLHPISLSEGIQKTACFMTGFYNL